jgi:GAF domain-containing protein
MTVDRRTLARRLEELLHQIDRSGAEDFDGALARLVDSAAVLLHAGGAGLMLTDEHEVLRYAAASDRAGRALETAQERLGAGPALESFRSNLVVACSDLPADERWPDLRHLVDTRVVRAVLSAPVSLPDQGPLGALNVYATVPRQWTLLEISAASAYADVTASVVGMALLARFRGVLLDRLVAALRSPGGPEGDPGAG